MSLWTWLDSLKTTPPEVDPTPEKTGGLIVQEQLSKFLPNLSADDVVAYTNAFNSFCPKYGIKTQGQFVMFLSQVTFESNRFTELTENLNYSAQGLLETFPTHFTAAEANEYARQPERIANRAYANRMGNGNEASGDGWRYRGAGLIQLTGKENHQAFANACGKALSDSVAYCATPEGAVESSCWYWGTHNLTQYSTYGQVSECTKIINGGENGLSDRQEMFTSVLNALT